mmetsp:Transcript_54335/g.168554  ORF Transcript_54335/g.168554 Transcript_54335/m.168554 type:complete len:168 (-) Transcript_54335:278-781(-)
MHRQGASSSSSSRAGAAGIPSGLASAPQRCSSVPTRQANGRDFRGCLKDRGKNKVAPWNPGIRFRGSESLESFHVIDQDMPPDARLSMRLTSTIFGDQTIHPRLLQKLPRLQEATTVYGAAPTGRAQQAFASGGRPRFSAPHSSSRDAQMAAVSANGPTHRERGNGI